MKNSLMNIMTFLRDAVRNDRLSIEVKQGEKGPAPHIWTDREIINDIKSRNPEFENIIKDFKLGLV